MLIQIDGRAVFALAKQVEAIRAKIPAAIARGLIDGGQLTRTQVQRALQKQTGLKTYNSVVKRTRGYRTGMSYVIAVAGKPPTRPDEFRVSVKHGPGGGVTVWMWNKPHKFKRSFEGTGEIAGRLRMRLLGPRLPLRGFDGPNLAKEAVKDDSAAAFYSSAATLVGPAVEKQLMKILAG